MNILIHSHLFPSPANPVLGTFVYYLAKALHQLGNSVTIVSPVPYVPWGISQKSFWWKYKNIPSYIEMDGLSVYYPRFFSIPRRKLFFIRGETVYWSSTFFYHRLLTQNQYDIIHAHVVLPDGVVANYLGKKFKLPFGITIHGADLYESIPESRLNFLRIRNTLKNARFVGVVSSKLIDLLESYKLLGEIRNLKVIYNGVNIPEIIKKIDWPDRNKNAIRILSVGHAIKRKGYEIVLRSLPTLRQKFPNLVYYIIGEGVDLHYFKFLAKELSVEDITFFLGAQPNEQVLSYMKDCDIFVLPSWDEAFGVVYLEAMALGKIVVGTEGEGVAEIIRDGENGFLVPAKNVEGFTTKMIKILLNLDKLDHIKRKAQDTVEGKFTWQQAAQEYLELYKTVIKFKE